MVRFFKIARGIQLWMVELIHPPQNLCGGLLGDQRLGSGQWTNKACPFIWKNLWKCWSLRKSLTSSYLFLSLACSGEILHLLRRAKGSLCTHEQKTQNKRNTGVFLSLKRCISCAGANSWGSLCSSFNPFIVGFLPHQRWRNSISDLWRIRPQQNLIRN